MKGCGKSHDATHEHRSGNYWVCGQEGLCPSCVAALEAGAEQAEARVRHLEEWHVRRDIALHDQPNKNMLIAKLSAEAAELREMYDAVVAERDSKGTPCPRCGQTDHGQYGEYPCPDCGLPTLWGTVMSNPKDVDRAVYEEVEAERDALRVRVEELERGFRQRIHDEDAIKARLEAERDALKKELVAANLGAERNAYIARSLAEKITSLKNDERILLETHQSLVDRYWIAEAECKTLEKECDTCFVRKERDALRAAILQTIEENGHLADGENCTLIALKRAVGET
jgi:hypothetical protein